MARFDNTRPVFRLGSEVVGALRNDVQWVSIEEDTRGMKRMRACFIAQSRSELAGDEPVIYLDGQHFDFGDEITVSMGAGDRARTIFEGRISSIEAELSEGEPAKVNVYAEDALMRLRMTRRCRTYRDVSDQRIAEEIAREHQLQLQGDVDGPEYEIVQQWNQSDLAFLRERARLVRAEIWVAGTTLHFSSRDNRSAPEIRPLAYGQDLLSVSVRADLAHQREAVVVSGFDADRREGFDGRADEAAVAAELEGGRGGAQILTQAFGEGRTSLRVREGAQNQAEADAWAKAEAQRRGRRFVTASAVVVGEPDLQVGCRLELRRIGRAFTGGGYYVTQVRHTWDPDRGHRTVFEAERPMISEAQ